MVKYIPRSLSKRIGELLSYFPAVGIVGPRQAGKTTLARHLQGDFLYLDLEDERDRSKLEADPYFFLERHEQRCVILDEVQQMPDIFRVLRSLIDENRRPGRFILLGSASPELLRQSAESLAGRIAYTELDGLSLPEVEAHFPWEEHWLRGGFPPSLLAPDASISLSWRSQLIRTYTERDLPNLGLEVSPLLIRRFWQMLAGENGGIWQIQKFSRALGTSAYQVKKMLHFLEGAYLVSLLPPWFANVSKRLIKSPKVYQRDTGLLHALLKIETLDELLGNTALGTSWEAYVIQQIRTCMPPDKFSLCFYRTHQGAECDLVLVKGNQPIAGIEIKFSSNTKPSKGFYIATEDLGTRQNFILTPGHQDTELKPGLHLTGLNAFLKDYLPHL